MRGGKMKQQVESQVVEKNEAWEFQMNNKSKNIIQKFEYFLMFFIVLQPILDLLTTFCIVVLHSSATIGIIMRLAVMIASGVYLLIKSKEKSNRKYLFYLIGLGVVLGIGLVNNFLIKEPILLGEEVKFIAKVFYVFVMAASYIVMFKSLKQQENKLMTYVLSASLIISLVMVVSILTSTDMNSYDYEKLGSRGWFFAGNDLGAILAIISPIVTAYAIEKTRSFKQFYYWIPVALIIFSLFAIGTKVGFGAVVVVSLVSLFMCIMQIFLSKEKEKKKTFKINSTIAGIVLIGVIISTPFTPIIQNTFIHLNIIEQKQAAKEQTEPEKEKPHTKAEKQKQQEQQQKEETTALIFSGRELFLTNYKQYFADAPITQKLFGMGYGGNFEDQPKMIERDFHDLFYSFGIVGFLFMILPVAWYGMKVVKVVITRFKQIFTAKYALLAVSLVLGLGIAYTAGHVFTSPAVSIYFVAILAYLLKNLEVE
jgi:hypothetical protein